MWSGIFGVARRGAVPWARARAVCSGRARSVGAAGARCMLVWRPRAAGAWMEQMEHVVFVRRGGRGAPAAAGRVGWAEAPHCGAPLFAGAAWPCRARARATALRRTIKGPLLSIYALFFNVKLKCC